MHTKNYRKRSFRRGVLSLWFCHFYLPTCWGGPLVITTVLQWLRLFEIKPRKKCLCIVTWEAWAGILCNQTNVNNSGYVVSSREDLRISELTIRRKNRLATINSFIASFRQLLFTVTKITTHIWTRRFFYCHWYHITRTTNKNNNKKRKICITQLSTQNDFRRAHYYILKQRKQQINGDEIV